MSKYYIWFEPVEATHGTIEADTLDEAKKKAIENYSQYADIYISDAWEPDIDVDPYDVWYLF